MSPDEYQADCLLTESQVLPDEFLKTRENQVELEGSLVTMVTLGERVDVLKKHLFYGREVDFDGIDSGVHIKADKVLARSLEALDCQGLTLDQIEDKQRMVRLLHALMGIQSEVSEIAAPLIEALHNNEPLDTTMLMEEGGDVLWYVSLLLDALGFKMQDTMERNIAKLAKRYPDRAFSSQHALNRDLDAERNELEA